MFKSNYISPSLESCNPRWRCRCFFGIISTNPYHDDGPPSVFALVFGWEGRYFFFQQSYGIRHYLWDFGSIIKPQPPWWLTSILAPVFGWKGRYYYGALGLDMWWDFGSVLQIITIMTAYWLFLLVFGWEGTCYSGAMGLDIFLVRAWWTEYHHDRASKPWSFLVLKSVSPCLEGWKLCSFHHPGECKQYSYSLAWALVPVAKTVTVHG
jgi:hypothetical protein